MVSNIAVRFFLLHIIGIIFTTFGWLITPLVLPIHLIVMLSWLINDNKCIISQLEYYCFSRTFMGEGKKYYVPREQRYLLYTNFILGTIYHRFFIFRYLKLLY
jgi:hypothetical protein